MSICFLFFWSNLSFAQVYDFVKITREEGLPTTGINDITQDSSGMYWLATEGAGLVRYDGKNFRIDEVVSAYGALVINSLGFDGEENLWLVTDKEILKYDGFRLKSYIIPGSTSDLKWYGHFKNNKLFVRGNEFFKIDGDSVKAIEPPLEKPLGKPLISNGTLSWLTSEGEKNISLANGLPKGRNLKAFKDLDNGIWLYGADGLYYLKGTFESRTVLGFAPTSIAKLDNNYYWSGLNSVNGISADFKTPAKSYAPKGFVTDMETFKGRLFVATEGGLMEYFGNKVKKVDLADNDGFVFRLFATENYLYIAGGIYLYRYDGTNTENVTLKYNLPEATIFDVSRASDGAIWFGTYTAGFIRKSGNNFEVFDELGRFSFDSLRISCIHAVSKDELWLGTFTEGLYHVSNRFTDHYNYNSLNFAEIRSLTADEDGRIWAGTGKGLYWITPGVTQGKAFVKVAEAACEENTLTVLDGKLLYGYANGVISFDINGWIADYRNQLKVSITGADLLFEDGEDLLSYSADSTGYYRLPVGMELPYDQNFLTFKFSGSTALYQDAVEYRYRLKGQTTSWTEAVQTNEAIYSNLSSGKYNFQVQARRKGNAWPDEITELSFTINRPFYYTWWFISTVVLLVGGLVYYIVSQRVKQANQKLRMENALMEMERKALRLQMNPHFIFNALDSISSFIFKKDPQQAVKYLNSFAKLMRLTLESSMEHVHPVETEVSILKNYLDLEKLRFSDKFTYEIELDDEIDYDIGIPPMLIQPHVENAILHGIKPKQGTGFISIKFYLREDQLICEIEDDGIGRKAAKELPNKKAHRSMATQINRDRVRLLRLSTEDNRVDLNYVDKMGANGEPAGTKVIITLVAEEI